MIFKSNLLKGVFMKKVFIVCVLTFVFSMSLSALPMTASAAGNNKSDTTTNLLSLGAKAYVMGYSYASRVGFEPMPSLVQSYCAKTAIKLPISNKFYFEQECIKGVLASYQIAKDMTSNR